MNLILLGPPGAGKGTQAKFIAKKFNLYQLSTGDLLREEIKNKTEIGKKIKHVIAHGDFVVDEIVNQLLKTVTTNPSNRNSIIFDGYPRNINQAENLETILNADNQSINFILFLKVSRETRVLKRRQFILESMEMNSILTCFGSSSFRHFSGAFVINLP